MLRTTLLDFFGDLAARDGEFLVYDDGYRRRAYRYDEVGKGARRFAARLAAAGLQKDDKVVFWGENRPEWIAAFWGCLLRGIVVVPIDYRASADFLERVRGVVDARLVVVGDEVDRTAIGQELTIWRFGELLGGIETESATPPPVEITRDDVAEIIFTSGATAEPKGVIITHRNILANIVPIEREMGKYLKYARPFSPIRFLNLLPLSHMFGQAMATFVPPMLTGTVIFMRGYSPHEIERQIKTRRVSVLVSVPKILDVLREHVLRRAPEAQEALEKRGQPSFSQRTSGKRGLSRFFEHWLLRWWHYRKIHRAFGWKFWSFVVGAAPLESELEEFWSRLGFLVVQGYGLTETAPIVTLNHPLAAQKGSVGKPIAGVDVKIADDGEILVRGENVTRGYVGGGADATSAFEDGWLHTGDIGGIDEQGRLFIRGRKKEMIVTPEGLNVFPEDVERALIALPGVRDAAVVGRSIGGEERAHAVLLLDPGVDADESVRRANATLDDHQKIRSASVWPDAELPRTEGTRKLRRREIKQWVESGEAGGRPPRPAAGAPLEAIVGRFASGRPAISDETTLDELGLSSLERVELMMALEERFQTTVDEAAYTAAQTVGDLRALVAAPELPPGAAVRETRAGGAPRPAAEREPIVFPAWNRRLWARSLRRLSLPTWILPPGRVFAHLNVAGREHLDALGGEPVVFAANHQSHFDTPVIFMALPRRYRYRTAVAMAKEFFKAHFFPEQHGRRAWFTNSLNYYLSSLFFNAFPLPQREAGTRHTLRYIGELIEDGHSVLIFPEGKRTERGEINTFRPGVGMIAARLRATVVPVRIKDVDKVLHQSWTWPAMHPVTVRFGAPMRLEGDDYAALAKQVEEAVRALD
ncbi:MAG: AMP-binding protein [Luteitalea sp.]|nr:AMP-binding protein [Luteitalea sp.]